MVIGDNGNDTDAVLDLIETAGALAEFLSKSKLSPPRPPDREIYRMRSLIERHFGKIKEFRRIATHHDKTARNILPTVHLAVSRFLLRRIANLSFVSTTELMAFVSVLT